MSEQMTCPACDSTTSSVLDAVRRGDPCPHCGLSAQAIGEFEQARVRGADESLVERAAKAERRAEQAETRARDAESALRQIARIARAGRDTG